MTTLRGIYRDGTVHLQEPLELPNETEVDVSVIPVEAVTSEQSERERIHALFVAAGVVRPHVQPAKKPPLSHARRAELAAKLASIGSIHDIIREERDNN
jgi:hypothetical protein